MLPFFFAIVSSMDLADEKCHKYFARTHLTGTKSIGPNSTNRNITYGDQYGLPSH